MAAPHRRKETKMASTRYYLVPALLLSMCGLSGMSSACELPADLRGAWVDSNKGILNFSNTTISGYDIYSFGAFNLDCYTENGTTYILESDSFMFFSLNFTGYFCWNFVKVSDDLYYFYEYTIALKDAGYEKVKMYLPPSPRVYNDICANTNPDMGTYRVLYRNATSEAALGSTQCPAVIQKYFSYNMTVGGVRSCIGDTDVDVCSSSTTLTFNGSNCTTTLGYSSGGAISCLFYLQSGDITYITLVNDDVIVDDSTTYRTTCMIIDSSSSPYLVTQYPKQCPDAMNASYVDSPGALMFWTVTGECPTSTTNLLWIIGLVLAILLLIAMLCGCLFYRKRQKEKERQRKLDEQRANHEDRDGRFNDDDNLSTRGDFPPNVTISIMEGRSRGRKDLSDVDDTPGFRTSGDVTPSGIQPSYDAPHRRFSKRRRVWVIGEDGNVHKVWKETKDGKESPDSGVEDEGEGEKPDGKAGMSKLSDKDKEARDFMKQFGRQDVKESGELTQKGDMHNSNTKLMTKIKKMAGIKSFAKARKKRAQDAKKKKKTEGSAYKDAGGGGGQGQGQGSSPVHDGDSSDGSYDSDVEGSLVLAQRDKNKLNEMSEKQEKEEERLKKSGGKGRDSPDSGTGRDSALSSHSSSYSTNGRDDRAGGGGGGSGGAGGDAKDDGRGESGRQSKGDKNGKGGKDGKGDGTGKNGKGPSAGGDKDDDDADNRGGGDRDGGRGGGNGGGKGGRDGKGGGGGAGGAGGGSSGGGGGGGGAGTDRKSGGSGGDGGGGGGSGDGSRSRGGGQDGGGGGGGGPQDSGGRGGDTNFKEEREASQKRDGGRGQGAGGKKGSATSPDVGREAWISGGLVFASTKGSSDKKAKTSKGSGDGKGEGGGGGGGGGGDQSGDGKTRGGGGGGKGGTGGGGKDGGAGGGKGQSTGKAGGSEGGNGTGGGAGKGSQGGGGGTGDGRGGGAGGPGGGDGKGGKAGGAGTTTTPGRSGASLARQDSTSTLDTNNRRGDSMTSFDRSGRGASRISGRKSEKSMFSSLASTRDDVTLPSMSSGFWGSDDGVPMTPEATALQSRNGTGSKGGRAGGSRKDVREDSYLGAGQSNTIQVTPRGEPSQDTKRPHKGKDPGGPTQNGGGAPSQSRQSNVRSDHRDSTISQIDMNDPFSSETPVIPIERSRPPTGHHRRQGWQEGDSSRSRSRSGSPDRGRSQVGRSQSERQTDSRSVRWQGENELSVPGTADQNGRRSVRWKEEGGSSIGGESLMVPVTPGMGIRRYPDSEASTPSRESRAYSSMSRLARLHRKKKAVGPMTDEESLDEARRNLKRPPDMDDLAWKRLLEELYPDKKYLDYAKATSGELNHEEHLHGKAGEGLSYLYDRAKFWQGQMPLVRPGTNMSVRSYDSRATSAAPTSHRGLSRAGDKGHL